MAKGRETGKPTAPSPFPLILPDHAFEGKAPSFDFDAYSRSLASVLRNPRNRTPLVCAVYGRWGSGKSTLLKQIEARATGGDGGRTVKPVWFNAWKYSSEDTVLAGLLRSVVAAMKRDGWAAQGAALLTEAKAARGGLWNFAASLFGLLPGAKDAAEAAAIPPDPARAYYDQFEEVFGQLIYAWFHPGESFRDLEGRWRDVEVKGRRVDEAGVAVVFIDDLDRCARERVVAVLEAVKLFMDLPRVAVVLAADRAAVLEELQAAYGDRAPLFLEKVIQVSFELPQVPVEGATAFAGGLLEEFGHPHAKEIRPHLDLVVRTAYGEEAWTPRALKTFLNDLTLRLTILGNLGKLGGEGKPTVEDAVRYQVLSHLLPGRLRSAKNLALLRRTAGEIAGLTEEEARTRALAESPEVFRPVLSREDARALAAGLPEDESVLGILAQIAPTPSRPAALSARPSSEGGFPASVPVPAGKFRMGDGKEPDCPEHEVELSEFLIDATPVTNSQYARFVREAAHEPPAHWKGAAPGGEIGDHPVTFVSWEDARAYCEWRSKETGERWDLPTEAQWEKAARGTDGRTYPWGDEEPTPERANYGNARGGTTPVGSLPAGDSFYGCSDMSGSVWEWCADWFGEDYYASSPAVNPPGPKKDSYRVLRGGSWGAGPFNLRCAYRSGAEPTHRRERFGFRCARSLS